MTTLISDTKLHPPPLPSSTALLSTLTLSPDASSWSARDVTAWAQALDLPLDWQNHLVDHNIRGNSLLAYNERDVERIIQNPESRIVVSAALQGLKYGGPHTQLFLHLQHKQSHHLLNAQIKTLQRDMALLLTKQNDTLRKDFATFVDRIIRSVGELLGISSSDDDRYPGNYRSPSPFASENFMQGIALGGVVVWFFLRLSRRIR